MSLLSPTPDLLKPVIEALIFASEEPLPARLIARLVNGEREERQPPDAPTNGVTTAVEEVEASPVTEGEAEAGLDDIVTTDELVESPEADEDEVEDQGEAGARAMADDADALADALQGAMERNARPSAGIDPRFVQAMVGELNLDYEETGRAFRIVEVAGGYQFATLREYGEYVALLSKEKQRRRLSAAALETLAIIAYRQPVSKPEVEAIRGVNCDQVLVNLMEKGLVAITGRSEAVGRPLLYGTTADFLRTFGLRGLNDLPKLREIEELMEEDAYSPERAEVITVDAATGAAEIEALVGAAGHEERDDRETEVADEKSDEPIEVVDASTDESDGDTPETVITEPDGWGIPEEETPTHHGIELVEEDEVNEQDAAGQQHETP